MTKFSEHFTVNELQCPTSLMIKLETGFIEALETLRVDYDKPMIVTSGCRSYEHNAKLVHDGYPASDNSLHLIENLKHGIDTIAVDIMKPNIYDQARLISIALYQGWTVRVGKSFIHFDMRMKYTELKQHFSTY